MTDDDPPANDRPKQLVHDALEECGTLRREALRVFQGVGDTEPDTLRKRYHSAVFNLYYLLDGPLRREAPHETSIAELWGGKHAEDGAREIFDDCEGLKHLDEHAIDSRSEWLDQRDELEGASKERVTIPETLTIEESMAAHDALEDAADELGIGLEYRIGQDPIPTRSEHEGF